MIRGKSTDNFMLLYYRDSPAVSAAHSPLPKPAPKPEPKPAPKPAKPVSSVKQCFKENGKREKKKTHVCKSFKVRVKMSIHMQDCDKEAEVKGVMAM